MNSPRRVLVEFDVRLGDLVIELPILHALRDELSPLSLEAIVHARCANLLEDYGWIRRVHVKDDTFGSGHGAILASLHEPFDLFLYIRRNPAVKLTRWLVRARRKIGAEAMDPSLRAAGVVRHRYSILRAVFPEGLPEPRTGVELEPGRAEQAMREADVEPGARLLCIGPGAKVPEREWPLERFAELCGRLAEMTGGASLAGVRLVHTAALLSVASLYVGNDSGLSHLAAAQGCPAVSIGLRVPYYRPWTGYGLRGDLARLTPSDVLDYLREESVIAD